jgi:hypothetical protein
LAAGGSCRHDKVVLGDPREGRLNENEKHRVAVHEAGHAIVAWALPHTEPLRRMSILPRGTSLGATEQVAAEDRHMTTRGELDARLAVLLGGLTSERRVLGEISTGAEHDLREATRIAEQMVSHFGMSDELGPVYYERHERHAFLGNRVATGGGPSDVTIHAIETQSRRLLEQARSTAETTLANHRPPSACTATDNRNFAATGDWPRDRWCRRPSPTHGQRHSHYRPGWTDLQSRPGRVRSRLGRSPGRCRDRHSPRAGTHSHPMTRRLGRHRSASRR